MESERRRSRLDDPVWLNPASSCLASLTLDGSHRSPERRRDRVVFSLGKTPQSPAAAIRRGHSAAGSRCFRRSIDSSIAKPIAASFARGRPLPPILLRQKRLGESIRKAIPFEPIARQRLTWRAACSCRPPPRTGPEKAVNPSGAKTRGWYAHGPGVTSRCDPGKDKREEMKLIA